MLILYGHFNIEAVYADRKDALAALVLHVGRMGAEARLLIDGVNKVPEQVLALVGEDVKFSPKALDVLRELPDEAFADDYSDVRGRLLGESK